MRKLFTISVLALLLVSVFAGLGVWQIKPVLATTTTLASTELLNFYSMTTGEITTFLNLLDDQNITLFIVRLNAFSEWSSGTSSGISKAKAIVTAANALGIDVAVDLHTWYTTWDNYFDDSASGHDANRATYITYVQNVLTSFASSNVYAFMVLNEPQAQTASTSENNFILDIIATAHTITAKPISVRFMGGYSASTGHYSVSIDAACDFICRNTYWDARYPTVTVYGTSEAKLLAARDYAHANSKEFWITEFGKPYSNEENQRSYVEAFVSWANQKDVNAIFCWVSQPDASGESYNIFNGYTPRPAFYELVNEVEEEPPLGDNVVVLNQPNNLESFDYFNILFNYTATFYQGSIANSSLWANLTGTWQLLGSNTTSIVNNTMHTINYTFAVEATYIWNIQVFNSTTAHWATSNRTLTIETSPPSDDPPTYGEHSVSTSMANATALFECDWADDNLLNYGLVSTNITGYWLNGSAVGIFAPHDTFSQLLTLPSSEDVIVGYQFYANDSVGQWNLTSTYTFTTSSSPSPPPVSERKTIVWAIDTDIATDIVGFAAWCNENYFNTVNVMGTGITTDNILYLHGQGLTVYKNVFPIPSCFPNYTYSTSYDLEEQMIAIATDYLEYDGIIMDDSHNAWRYAHNCSMFETDYIYYQWLIDNATEYLTPIFGADNVNLIMYIGGDECNFTKMPLINCTGLTFSYYYPPDPLFQYYGPEADIEGDWWLGIFKNTTANSWDIKSYYDTYGLNEYYAYEGWMWNPSENQHPKTETFIKTYNAIVELSETYTVHNLNIGFHWTLYNNTEVTKIIRHLCHNWLDGPTRMDENPIYIYDWDTYYWNETFDTLPYNYSGETYLGWQYISDTANYKYDADDDLFRLNFSGSNPAGYKGFSLERMFTTERDLNISLDFTPSCDNIHKYVILREGYVSAQHWAYYFDFGAFTYDLAFTYRIAKAIYPNYDVTIDLGHWTADCTYHINFQVTLLNASVSISNSTWSWNYTIPDDVMYYNTIKIGYLSLASTIGVTGDINVTSFTVDNVRCEPLTAWNPPFELENYIGYDKTTEFLFIEDGLLAEYTHTYYSAKAYLYGTNNTYLIVTCPQPSSVYGDIISYSYLNDTQALYIIISSSSMSTIYIDWLVQPLLPFTFIIGMVGLASSFAGPMYAIYKLKKGEYYEGMRLGVVITALGFALTIAWLWSV